MHACCVLFCRYTWKILSFWSLRSRHGLGCVQQVVSSDDDATDMVGVLPLSPSGHAFACGAGLATIELLREERNREATESKEFIQQMGSTPLLSRVSSNEECPKYMYTSYMYTSVTGRGGRKLLAANKQFSADRQIVFPPKTVQVGRDVRLFSRRRCGGSRGRHLCAKIEDKLQQPKGGGMFPNRPVSCTRREEVKRWQTKAKAG